MLKWTSKRPTEPGWYWFRPTVRTPSRAQARELRILEIEEDAGGRFWCRFHSGAYTVDQIAGYFSGPLEPPDFS